MLIVDELKKSDPQLRLVAIVLAGGFFILLAGLWWVQVVSSRGYQAHLDTQANRTIRVPAARGKILDREGRVLAENRPRYDLSLYFDDLSGQFTKEFNHLRPVEITVQAAPFWKFWRRAPAWHTNRVRLKPSEMDALMWQARYNVVARIAGQTARQLGQSVPLDPKKFVRSYSQERYMPFTLLPDLDSTQIARFQESLAGGSGADLELQSVRSYPYGATAAHVLGELKSDDSSQAGEESFFNYRLPDYAGVTGIESSFNDILHGRAGQESVTINNMGYRVPDRDEDVDSAPQAGENVVLTLDVDLQQAAEKALLDHHGATANAAVVVMDVRNGDVLAMASSPTFDPNDFAQRISAEKYAQLQALSAEKNRATQENYAPGSIFKVVVGLAALEAGLNPDKLYTVDPDPADPAHGLYDVRHVRKKDTAPPGQYGFKRAIERSSNSYFIQIGLLAGVDRIVELAEKFHFGETTFLSTHQETRGDMPTLERVHHDWREGDTANICIGQGEVAVTPLQMAVAYSAIANGGTVYWPRLVSRLEPQDPSLPETATNLPAARVRDQLGVSARSLRILHEAMLGETEDVEGTGKSARVAGLDICGKTGTAQVQDSTNRIIGYNYWFGSFAPYAEPRYAVVVMVQIPGSRMMPGGGGAMCAPVAHDVYEAIMKKQNSAAPKVLALAN